MVSRSFTDTRICNHTNAWHGGRGKTKFEISRYYMIPVVYLRTIIISCKLLLVQKRGPQTKDCPQNSKVTTTGQDENKES